MESKKKFFNHNSISEKDPAVDNEKEIGNKAYKIKLMQRKF